jgi:alanine-synthesizing transaminase
MFAKRTNWNLTENALSQALAAHRAAGRPLLDLTVSNPTECGFEYDAEEILAALRNPAALRYEPNARGLVSAREAVVEYYAKHGARVAVDDIFLTTSTSEAYSFVFRLICDPGDEVLVPAPSYPLLVFLADLQDVKLVHYALLYDHGWQTDFHALEQAITPRTRAVVVVHPNNPTGHYCKPQEMRRLTELCAERSLAIVADEVFLDFHLAEEKPASFAGNSGALTFTMSGLSKICGLPQMKAAWLICGGPDELKRNALSRLEVIADTYLSMNSPVQLALPGLMKLRHSFQKQVLARMRKNLAGFDGKLSAAQKSPSRLPFEGGWYAILRLPASSSDEAFAIDLLTKKNVYVHPGHFYDFSLGQYLVLSLIPPHQLFCSGVERILAGP